MVQRGRRKNSNKRPSAVAAVATGSGQPHKDSSAATVTPVEDQPRKRGRPRKDSSTAAIATGSAQPRKRGRPRKDSSSAPPPKKRRICTANQVEVQVQAPPDGQPVLSARAQRLLRRNNIKDAQQLSKPMPKAKSPIVVHHTEPEPQVIVNVNQVNPEPQVIVNVQQVKPKSHQVIFQRLAGPLKVPPAFTQVVNSLPKVQAEDAKDVTKVCTETHVQIQAPPDGQPAVSARAQRLLRRNQIKNAQLLIKPTPKAKAPTVVHHSEPDPEPHVMVNVNQVEPESDVIVNQVQPEPPRLIVEPKAPVILKGFEGPCQVPLASTEVIKLPTEDVNNVPKIKDVEVVKEVKKIKKPKTIFKGFEGPLYVHPAFIEVINSLPKLPAKVIKSVTKIEVEAVKIEKPKPIFKGFERPLYIHPAFIEALKEAAAENHLYFPRDMPTLTPERPLHDSKQFLSKKNFDEDFGKFEAYLDEVFSLSTPAAAGPVTVEVDLEPGEVVVRENIEVEEPVLSANGDVKEIESPTEPEWTPLVTPEDAHKMIASTPLSDTAEPEDWFLQSVPTPQTPANILDIWLDDREQVLFAKPAATHLISTTGKEVEGHLDQPPLTPKWDQMDQFMQVMALCTSAPTAFGPKDDPTPLPTKEKMANSSKDKPTTSGSFFNWRSSSPLSS